MARWLAATAGADDAGGVWIVTGIVLGVLLYGCIVLMDVAGFTAVAPLVVIPPVLLGLIAANNLLRGGRSHGRPTGRPVGGGQAPLASLGDERVRGRARQADVPPAGTGRRGASRAEMTLFRDRGVVLRTIRLGEADRIVTLMTEQHGKVRAVAKGVRRTTSKFGSRLEPLSHVALLGWQGRGDLDMINQVEVIDTFRPVREDLDRMGAAMSMLEVVDQIGQERHANPRLYEMLVGAVAALAGTELPDGGARLLPQGAGPRGLGPGPRHVRVVRRGGSRALVAFDLVEGGVLCRSCRRGRALSPDGLALLRRTLGGGLAGVLAEPRSPVTDEVTALATEAMEAHLDRRLRSVRSGQVS